MTSIRICDDYTDTPGARYRRDGEYSGEDFRESLLLPGIRAAQQTGEKLSIDFAGGYGYPTSFLEEAFGGLVREHGISAAELKRVLILTSDDEPSLVREVLGYIEAAGRKQEA